MRTVVVAAFVLAALGAGGARAETCFAKGEEAKGLGKVCYYRCTFGETAVNVSSAAQCPLTAQASPSAPSDPARKAGGGACFKEGERATGMTKQCIYDCTGARKVVTVGSAQLCPLTAR
jgi:hypothetical protein